MPLQPDRTEAERFLKALDPSTDRFTFQTFDDNAERKKERKANGKKKDPFAKVFNGTLAQHWDALVKLNAKGAGIFVTVNITDLQGRTCENMTGMRVLFTDLDGAPLDPVIAESALTPQIINETSPGRWHAYWCIDGNPLAADGVRGSVKMLDATIAQFSGMQKTIAARYGGDAAVHDLPRVMRLPGFVHRKGEPFLSRVVTVNSITPYTWNKLLEEFPPVAGEPTWAAQKTKKPKGKWGELNERALKPENLSKWVLQIFPTAKRTRAGGYRVASADLGRGFEEDLAVDPRGIKYFGIADQGDKRQGRRTAVELIAEWQLVELPDAAAWLEKALAANGKETDGPQQEAPPPPEPPPQPEPASEIEIEITRLAKLTALEYEQQRKAAAEKLDIRASILDRLVRDERARLGLDAEDGKQGRSIAFPDPEPWQDEVDGAALLDDLATSIRRHVVVSDAERDATTLWVLHAYLIDCFLVSPRLGITSPVKRCGKTTLLDVLSRLVPRALPTANVTAAALFRVVEGYRPTLLVDEAETFLHDNDELRGVLNSGHRKGGTVLRTVGDDHEPRAFNTFCPTVIALIGHLPDTLHDRAVSIELKRALRSEKVEPYRPDRADHLDALARKATRWAKDHAEHIAAADPRMPDGVVNREADNWRPLLAIAAEAGGQWPERARKAAEAAHIAAGGDEASRLELLLGDIRGAFAEKGTTVRDLYGAERIELASADLVKVLVGLEGRPWAEMGKPPKPITQNRVARMLKPLGIAPQKVGPEGARVSGYVRSHFDEAFARYLPSEGVSQPDIRTGADEIRTSDISKVDSPTPGCPVAKSQKSNNDGALSGCPVGKGGPDAKARARTSRPRSDDPLDQHGAPLAANGGTEPGLSQRRIGELAHWYIERACANAHENGGDTRTAVLDAGLRQVLAEQVLPEFIEIEFARVMAEVFRV